MRQLGVHPALGTSCSSNPQPQFICTPGPGRPGFCFLTPEASVFLSNLGTGCSMEFTRALLYKVDLNVIKWEIK